MSHVQCDGTNVEPRSCKLLTHTLWPFLWSKAQRLCHTQRSFHAQACEERLGTRQRSKNAQKQKKEGAAKAYKQNSSNSATVAFNPRRDAVFLRLLLGISNPTLNWWFCLVFLQLFLDLTIFLGQSPPRMQDDSFQNWFSLETTFSPAVHHWHEVGTSQAWVP